MASVPIAPPRATRLLLRCAIAVCCAVALSGCVVYPGGYYGGPRPAYYYGGGGYGYYGHPGYR